MKKTIAILCIVLLFAFGCSKPVSVPDVPQESVREPSPSSEPTDAPRASPSSEVQTQVNVVPEEAPPETKEETVQKFEIIATNWQFTPDSITVSKGTVVELTVTSREGTHGLRIPDFSINERLEENRPVTVRFTADKKGTFPFACSVPCGSGHSGMRGQIVVE